MSSDWNTELQHANERIAHLNQVLLGIRNVNQLIVSEADPYRLISGACTNLTESMGYLNAWIALMKEDASSVTLTASSGFDDRFPLLLERLEKGDFPGCMRNALLSDTTVLMQNPVLQCLDCPLSAQYEGRAGFARRLVFGGKLYGIVAVSVPASFAQDEEEQTLFAEMAGELAFALHKIEEAQIQRMLAEKLRQSEEKFNKAFQSSPDAFILARVSDDSIVEINDSFTLLAGISAQEALGNTIQNLGLWVDRKARDEYMRRIRLHGRVRNFEAGFHARPGGNLTVLISGTIIATSSGDLFLNIVRDISERKRAEEELRERERYLSAILRTTADGFWVLDSRRHLIEVNDSYCTMSGYARNELLQMHIHDLDAMETDSETEERIRRIIKYGSELFETRHRRKDGSLWPVEVSTSYIPERDGQFICFCRDLTERKQRERVLKQHSHLLEHSPDAVYVSDDKGRIVYANSAAIQQTGFASDDIVGKSICEIDADFQVSEYNALFESLRESCSISMRTMHRRKDGRLFPVEITLSKLVHEGASMLCGIARDITERLQHEEQVTLLSRMLDEAPAAITIHDGEGRFLYANLAAVTLHGYDTPEEFLSINLHKLDVPESEAQIEARIRQIDQAGEARFEVRHLRKDGTAFPLEIIAKKIEWHGQPALLSIAVDITEGKKAEEALRASEQRLQSVFRSIPVGIGVVNNRVFQHVNQRVCEISGYPESELIGRNARMLYPSDEEYENVGRVKYAQIQQQGAGTVETQWQRKDGALISVLLSSSPIDLENLQKGVTFTVMDITQRYVLEEQLRQAQKMESVGRLAGGVAHDFNNMLNVILGHAGLILHAVPADSPLQEDIREIHDAAERSANLTQQLLAFARKQTVAPKVLDLNDTIMNMHKILERLIGENIKLVLQLGPELWPVKVDPSQIDQILANLCVNARDAIADVGRITIRTENCVIDEAYCLQRLEARVGSYVMIAVSDTGCGMNQEVRSHLFEPFFTTKDIGKGTGLGLSTVYGIVHQNEGFILIDSEPGEGATFSIYLPRYNRKAVSVPKAVSGTSAPGHETILLVEDEPSMLRLTRKVCEILGYRVIAAATPGEALQLAREHAGEIHLLLTDVIMPEMNGRDLAKNLLNLYPNLKRLFMSGYTADVIAHHGVLEEGVQFIQKPFTADILAGKIRETLDYDSD